jgi:dihydrofolate synthase/folylpolyglutamate synthase
MEQQGLDSVYKETLDFLFSQLPMFQRVGAAAYKADLTNTIALCRLIGNPEQQLRFVHVAGTNGKGSVSHMTASVLQTAGYKTGLFTSPHLRDFRERIKINGQKISKEAVVNFVEQFRDDWAAIRPSFFEITFAMAVWYFKQEGVNIVVLETGMGGRLDSTNVVRPEVCAITTIGFDHMQFLGETIPAIAGEKAGIIKPTVPVVLGALQPEAHEVMLAKANSVHAPVFESRDFLGKVPELDLKGPYQRLNAPIALGLCHVLQQRGFRLTDADIAQGLSAVVANTGLLGRWQKLSEKPLTIADCAHNEEGLALAMRALSQYDFHNLHIVIGVSGDKELTGIMKLLPREANYYFTAADIPRALPADELQILAERFGLRGEVFSSVRKAYEAARMYAKPNDLIYIGGSVFVVAEVV